MLKPERVPRKPLAASSAQFHSLRLRTAGP